MERALVPLTYFELIEYRETCAELNNSTREMHVRDIKFAGATILLGTLLAVLTVLIEFSVDWSTPGTSTELARRAEVFSAAWPLLSKLWIAQMVGALLMTIGALNLIGSPLPSDRVIPIKILLATAAVSGVIVTASFGQALGAYPVALEHFEDAPSLFATLMGELSITYRASAALLGLSYLVFAIQEGFTRDGLLPRFSVYIVIALWFGAIITIALSLLLPKTAGIVAFAAPALIGWYLLKYPGTQTL